MTTSTRIDGARADGDRPGRLKSAKRTEREGEILTVAAQLFYEKGYGETSIQDIADALGILKGSLYHYIRNKEDVLLAVIEEFHESALANMERVDSLEAGALEKIAAFAGGYVRHTAENLPAAAVFARDFRFLTGENRSRVVDKRDVYDDFLRDLIADGQRSGEICPDIDVKISALGILGLMNSLYFWYRPDGSHSATAIADEYAVLICRGLECDPATHVPGHRRSGILAMES